MIGERKILVVDDEKVVRKSLSLYLTRIGFNVVEAENGVEAKNLLEEEDVYFLVFTDITMPEMNGLDLLNHITELEREIDVVMITGHMNIEYAINAIKKGAFDYLKKPFLLESVHATLMRVLEKQSLKRKSIELELLKERQRTEGKNLTEFMIMLANIIDAKSPHTLEHSERVSEYSVEIGKKIGLSEDELKLIALGAKLHDIGKLGTPDYILHKNGPLTEEEYEIIKEHPSKGAEMGAPISSWKSSIEITHYHTVIPCPRKKRPRSSGPRCATARSKASWWKPSWNRPCRFTSSPSTSSGQAHKPSTIIMSSTRKKSVFLLKSAAILI
jgi:putative nucleotidyltransferase with HDIG domain